MRGRFRVSFLCCYRNRNNGSVGAMTWSEEYFGKSPVTVANRLWLCLYKAELFKWNCQYLYGSCGENFVLCVCCYNKFLPLWSKISICSVMSANSLVTDFFGIFSNEYMTVKLRRTFDARTQPGCMVVFLYTWTPVSRTAVFTAQLSSIVTSSQT